MLSIRLIFYCSIFIVMLNSMPTYAGITPHSHEKHLSKEREKDGIYQAWETHQTNNEHNVEFDHEAIIGNVKEAQEFDTLSPEESKKRLTILIQLMDLNKDRYIDRHELKAWILRSFKKLSEEEAADRFAELDRDNDGHILWKEYISDVYAMEDEYFEKDPDMGHESYDEDEKLIKDDKEMFTAADLNKDGSLNSEEFVLFQNPEENPRMLPVVFQQTMRDKDINTDGKIDFQEFVAKNSDRHDKEWLITEKERFDKDYDLNHDGVLTDNEVLNWLVPSNEAMADDEVNHLFASTDEDHDDRLSYIEILNNYETFVGSEATDYGDHLQNIHSLKDEF